MQSKQLKIFVSSTFVDLEKIREKVLKFLGVLDSDLISMEVFGSNEQTPKDVCLNQVRESNFFIGIYAERYGFVDPESEKSLTELEYHVAYDMLNQNKMSGILLYILNEDAIWPIKFVDRDNEKIEKLKSFKSLIKTRHTITIFENGDELPFQILRDTIRKLELGNEIIYHKNNTGPISQISRLEKPIGMSFFESNYSNLFYGRNEETDELIKQIFEYNFGLLIGVSGVGKTSILNAGVLPKLELLGWSTCITRPLNSPLENLKKSIWYSFFISPPPLQFDLDEIILTIQTEYNSKKVLIVIDQFDDILNSTDNEKKDIIDLLNRLYKIKSHNIHFLISYRGDLESEIGFFWQKISGAVDGLPRFYLNHLSEKSAFFILKQTFNDLNLQISEILLRTIVKDISVESKKNNIIGIFPPFLQMVIASLYESRSGNAIIDNDYKRLGKSEGIIANFLFLQLNFLGRDRENAIIILLSLVNQIGAKKPKRIDEIIKDTQLNEIVVSKIINRLLDTRLIRSIDTLYEITHDLLAKNIVESLQTDEEKEIRRFKGLLESKALAFKTTNSALSFLEHLHIYKLRKRIECTTDEFILLLESSKNTGLPVLFWLNEDNLKCITEDHVLTIQRLCYRNNVVIDQCLQEGTDLLEESYTDHHLINLSKKHLEEKFAPFFDKGIQFVSYDFYDSSYLTSSTKYKKLLSIIALAKYGDIEDLKDLINIYQSLEPKEIFICFRAIIFLSQKLNKQIAFDFLISYKGPYWQSLLNDLSISQNMGSSENLKIIFDAIKCNERKPELTDYLVRILKKIANESNKETILDFITKRINEDNEEIIYDKYFSLALHLQCDFKYFIELMYDSINTFNIKYTSLIHEKIALLATEHDLEFLKSFAQKHLIRENDVFLGRKDTGVKNGSNQFFFLWIIGCAYCRLVKDEDLSDLIVLVRHKLYTIRNAALNRIVEIKDDGFINEFFKVQLGGDKKRNQEYVHALSLLDLRLYLNENLRKHLETKLGIKISIKNINYMNVYSSKNIDPIRFIKEHGLGLEMLYSDQSFSNFDDAPF